MKAAWGCAALFSGRHEQGSQILDTSSRARLLRSRALPAEIAAARTGCVVMVASTWWKEACLRAPDLTHLAGSKMLGKGHRGLVSHAQPRSLAALSCEALRSAVRYRHRAFLSRGHWKVLPEVLKSIEIPNKGTFYLTR